jgi:hypothetical protein
VITSAGYPAVLRGERGIGNRSSEYVADDVHGSAPVRLLLTDLVSHAEADRPTHL